MSSYTVLASALKKVVPPAPGKQYGNQVFALSLQDEAGHVQQAEWFARANEDLPVVGAVLNGSLTPGKFGLNFKQDYVPPSPATATSNGRSSGGGDIQRQTNPVDAARMGRCHAQDMALGALRLAIEINLQMPKTTQELRTALTQWTDWFDADVQGSKPVQQQALSSPVQVPQPAYVQQGLTPTGQSDVPGPGPNDFKHPAPDGSDHPFDDPTPAAAASTDKIDW